MISKECDSADRPAVLSIGSMCRILSVSKSGYYAWLKRRPSKRALANEGLSFRIAEIFHRNRGRYGAPRVTRVLAMGGERVSRKRVARLMHSLDLSGTLRPPRRRKALSLSSPLGENILARRFSPELQSGLDRSWVSDMTYFRTAQGWLYLAVVIDLASRRVVGWATGRSLEQQTQIAALRGAILTRDPAPGLLHHSDRGSQYVAADYRAMLESIGARQSWSRGGNCLDNAVAESFFATLKTELRSRKARWRSRELARAAIVEYLHWYNTERLHSSLAYRSPDRYEAELLCSAP